LNVFPEGLVGDRGRELVVLWSLEANVAALNAPLSVVLRFGIFRAGLGFGLGVSASVFWPLKASVAPFKAALVSGLVIGR
jgi:hypothetical protein